MCHHQLDKMSFLINLHLFFFLLYNNSRRHHHYFWDLCSKNIFCVICDVRFELWFLLLLLIYYLDEIAFKLAAHVDFHEDATAALAA
jgi:hypothetical protein